jgi:Sec-independent protein translocase protein TatA
MYQEFQTAFINAWGSPMEMLVVAFAALMLFGAKSLPNALRTLGKWQHKFSSAWREIQKELIEIEEPFQNARKTWEEEMEEFTVSSPSRSRTGDPKTLTGPADQSDQSDPSDPSEPSAPTPSPPQEKPHAE